MGAGGRWFESSRPDLNPFKINLFRTASPRVDHAGGAELHSWVPLNWESHPCPDFQAFCWDSYNRRFRTRSLGKTYILGSDYAKAHEKFARLHRQYFGRPPADRLTEPFVVAELVLTWLRFHNFCDNAKQKHWTRAQRWPNEMLRKWSLFEGETKLEDLADDCLIQFHRHCEGQDWSAHTVKHYIAHAAKVLRFAREREWIDFEPKRPKLRPVSYVPQDMDPAKIRKFLTELDQNTRRRRAARLVRFILNTGCRPKEARLLKWGHIRLDQKRCVLPPAEHKTGKQTGAARVIHLNEPAMAILTNLKPKRAKSSDYVFKSRLGTPYTRDGLHSILSGLGTYPYALRHTWAQSAIDQGAPLEDVAALMGHKSVTTTRQYAEIRSQRAASTLHSLSSPEQLSRDASPPRRSRADGKASKKRRGKKRPK